MNSVTLLKLRSPMKHLASFLIGFLVRPCCSIPLLFAVLGLSGAGLAAALAPYQKWFLGLAVIFFTVSFYFNFIRNRNRAGMIVWALSVLVAAIVLLGSPGFAQTGAREKARPPVAPTQDMKQIEFKIEGMACEACARRLQTRLDATAGVRGARVRFAEKQALMLYDPQQVTPDQIAARIKATGFRATVQP